jgi:hypothetical protein
MSNLPWLDEPSANAPNAQSAYIVPHQQGRSGYHKLR